jgi:thymidylate synthase (FAD)
MLSVSGLVSKNLDLNTGLGRKFEKIEFIPISIGVEETYDIEMTGLWPNFCANGFVVHNSFNEFSMRYAEVDEPDYFIPSQLRTQVGKPGAYHFEDIVSDDPRYQTWLLEVKEHCNFSTYLYERAIELGIAREQARIVFPVNIYTEFHWSINARSLLNFLSLRNSPHAMKEIRDYAIALESILELEMPITYSAFIENNRIAV